MKARRAKTPFLNKLDPDEPLPQLPAKVPPKKKTPEEKAAAEEAEKVAAAERAAKAGAARAEKANKRKKDPLALKRHIPQMFVRGDSIIMMTILDNETG